MRQPIVVNVTQPGHTEYVTREVHEHRAPTDESVKLLREMEQAAAGKVLESVRVGDTTFECVVHTEHDVMSDQMVFVAIFSLNGKKERAEHRASSRQAIDAGAMFRALRDEIAKVIATRMIETSFRVRCA